MRKDLTTEPTWHLACSLPDKRAGEEGLDKRRLTWYSSPWKDRNNSIFCISSQEKTHLITRLFIVFMELWLWEYLTNVVLLNGSGQKGFNNLFKFIRMIRFYSKSIFPVNSNPIRVFVIVIKQRRGTAAEGWGARLLKSKRIETRFDIVTQRARNYNADW